MGLAGGRPVPLFACWASALQPKSHPLLVTAATAVWFAIRLLAGPRPRRTTALPMGQDGRGTAPPCRPSWRPRPATGPAAEPVLVVRGLLGLLVPADPLAHLRPGLPAQ